MFAKKNCLNSLSLSWIFVSLHALTTDYYREMTETACFNYFFSFCTNQFSLFCFFSFMFHNCFLFHRECKKKIFLPLNWTPLLLNFNLLLLRFSYHIGNENDEIYMFFDLFVKNSLINFFFLSFFIFWLCAIDLTVILLLFCFSLTFSRVLPKSSKNVITAHAHKARQQFEYMCIITVRNNVSH